MIITSHRVGGSLLVLCLALAACGDDTTGAGGSGGSSSSGDGGATSSTGDGGSTTSTGDGGSTGAGDGGGTPVDPATLPDSGGVGFYQFGPDAEVSARFQRDRRTDVEYAGGCDDWVEVGSCRARRCYGDMVHSGGGMPGLGAGAMTASGLLQSVSPAADDSGHYEWRGSGALFEPGDELSASFAGAEVPAFTATITAPPRIDSLEPELEGLVIAGGDDLDLTWTIDGAATVELQLLALGDDVFDAVLCEFEGDALAGTVPSELIPGDTTLIASAYTRAEEHVAVGSFDVTVQVLDMTHTGAVSVE